MAKGGGEARDMEWVVLFDEEFAAWLGTLEDDLRIKSHLERLKQEEEGG
jgi:hypothetical protein